MSQRLKRGWIYIEGKRGHQRSGGQSLSLRRAHSASLPHTKGPIMHAICCASIIFIREINMYFPFEFALVSIILYSTAAAPPVGKQGKFQIRSF